MKKILIVSSFAILSMMSSCNKQCVCRTWYQDGTTNPHVSDKYVMRVEFCKELNESHYDGDIEVVTRCNREEFY